MKKDLTELVFILDRSGSMAGLERDTIGGYNSMLTKQQEQPGECIVTTVLFDDKYELLHDRINLRGVRPITQREYFARGMTALLDAVGMTLTKTINAQENTAEEERAEHVLFVITTDGYENASREYTYDKVRQMIEQQKRKGWEFIFLGANIDAISTAARFGIAPDRAANYNADGEGTRLNFETVSSVASDLRAARPVAATWKAAIDKDFKRRRK
ncbi:MAG: hypothetical protein ACI3VB_04070 [Oscillospiraceae bacterium]